MINLAGIPFFKYEGTGNDFVLIDEFEQVLVNNKSEFAKKVCRRRHSIGADGVLYLKKTGQHPLMHMYNPDGTGPEMCGNGIRCVALHCVRMGYSQEDVDFIIDTNVGKKTVRVRKDEISVNMGTITFASDKIPIEKKYFTGSEFILQPIRVDGKTFVMSAASIGNPHLLGIIENLDEFREIDRNLERVGPLLENHPYFPERINVHFAYIKSENEIELITWERGAGRTLACGTGATTSVGILYRLKKISLPCRVNVPGGLLKISKNNDEWIMTGKANYVFRGVIDE